MGELRALRWSDIDLDANVIQVRRTWDDVEGEQVCGKSKAAMRTVVLIDELRPFLLAHKLATGRRDEDLAFGRTADEAHERSTIRRRARVARKAAKLTPITPHECRHSFGSLLAARRRLRGRERASAADGPREQRDDGQVRPRHRRRRGRGGTPAAGVHRRGHRVSAVGRRWDATAPTAAVLSVPQRHRPITAIVGRQARLRS